jgi:hypothetical protein
LLVASVGTFARISVVDCARAVAGKPKLIAVRIAESVIDKYFLITKSLLLNLNSPLFSNGYSNQDPDQKTCIKAGVFV